MSRLTIRRSTPGWARPQVVALPGGVMPGDFQFPDKTAELWLPLATDSRWPAFQQVRFADAFFALGRLRPGVSIDQARSEMNAGTRPHPERQREV